jgi:hypothetical protein
MESEYILDTYGIQVEQMVSITIKFKGSIYG